MTNVELINANIYDKVYDKVIYPIGFQTYLKVENNLRSKIFEQIRVAVNKQVKYPVSISNEIKESI